MNQIRAIQALNKKEIEHGISPDASWHVDYRDTAYIYFGGLPYELSEGDVITIFSQFGEPSFLKLVRDKETGKSKGFGWLKYEDQRSTDLAVDNLGGAEIGGRLIRVDHARYKARDDEDPEEFKVGWEDIMKREGKNVEEESSEEGETRPALPEERELALLIRDHDEDDPMKGFLIEEKKKEVEEARRRADKKEKRHRHKHRSHRSDRDDSDEGRSRRSRRDETLVEREWRHRDKEPRRHRGRDDSRDRERRRRRHDDDDDDQGRHRDRNRDRRRHSREGSEEPRRRRHRDDPDDDDDSRRKPRRRSRSRSPQRHDD